MAAAATSAPTATSRQNLPTFIGQEFFDHLFPWSRKALAQPRQCIGLGSPLAVRRVCRGDRITRNALLALPLHIHQSHQDIAQVHAPHSGSGFKAGRGSLTQTWHGPKVE